MTTANISESAARAARDLRVMVGRLRRRLRDVYDGHDLSPSQTSVLSRLDKEGPASASELASAERIRPQSVATTLAALEKRGLIQRHPDPGDRRRQLISLSQAGRDVVDDSRHAREEWLSRALQDHYTEAERRLIIEAMTLLERLTHS